MKRGIILLFFIIVWPFVQAQTPATVSYSYDANGNRVSRSIVFSRMEEGSGDDSLDKEYLTSIQDEIGHVTLNIYPNPTNDRICVERNDTEGNGNMVVFLSSVTGVLVCKVETDNNQTFLDLSNLSSGIYIIKVDVNGEQRCWKVIKR